ncbi:MAG: hypothetical protein LLF94_03120, partial [Chlamydiales bacterium]|nr:hypothetical protein [Chlamydiales bacterium]
QEAHIPAFCIDLDIQGYPKNHDALPDPYAITKIGLKDYYEAYAGTIRADPVVRGQHDKERELYMAKRLRELSFTYDKILVVVGMSHVAGVLAHLKDASYPVFNHVERSSVSLATYSEEAVRQMLGECGWISTQYEEWRGSKTEILDRNSCNYELIKTAQIPYEANSGNTLTTQSINRIFSFCRNWAHLRQQLLPDFVQLLSASKSCVDHNFAYEVWKKGTEYSFYKNVDSLPIVELTPEEVWGNSKSIYFHLKAPSDKGLFYRRLRKDQKGKLYYPPNPFSICSYPPEDSVVEKFGVFLKKKGVQQQTEEAAHTIPYANSLEDGIDVRETIRHWPEKKLYVKARGKPPGLVGSCVVIFDEDQTEHYPAKMTWLGENDQESDMAFYSTSMADDIIGPGIARCKYGGFILSYPARRMYDVWMDPDYEDFEHKHEVLLAAAIDYSVRPVIVYAGVSPPDAKMKTYAARQGKRILYIPITQFSKNVTDKLRTFHILDGQDKRKIADEYIY